MGETGDLSGRVNITQPIRENSQIGSQEIIRLYSFSYGGYDATSSNRVAETPRVVIYLESPKNAHGLKISKKWKNAPKFVTIDQKNEQFIPHILPIRVGTVVRFLNSDSVYHNVFSLSPVKSFDLGKYPRGQYRSVKFDKPGVVNVYCDIHTHMSAYILVLDTPYFTQIDSTGHFKMEQIPAGEYRLVAWYGRWPKKSQPIKIIAGKELKVNITFP